MKKAVISIMCAFSILCGMLSPMSAVISAAESDGIIDSSDIALRLQYDEQAPFGGETASTSSGLTANDGWERWSLPIGNGYFGANVFGRTETERIQITEKTLANPYYKTNPQGKSQSLGGLNNFSETYLDFGHTNSDTSDYSRWLDLKTAISGVSYVYNDVTYTREYFTSYPDKALVIRLDASKEGALDFVLRPTIPWEQEYAAWEGDGASKEGTVKSYLDGDTGIVELSGKLGFYDVDFLGMYRVVAKDGEVSATTTVNNNGETDGTITVTGATSCYIYVTLGTDYELTSEVFTSSDKQKPTFNTTIEDTRKKINGYFTAISSQLEGKSYEEGYAILKNNHLADYTELFGRVSLNLGDESDADLTTDALLSKYQSGQYSNYLEALYFQYGRYLLIASSRSGALPSNLQGTWNRYNFSPWGSGYWHNINVQMNYWPAFNTNLAETFESYVEFNAAYMPAAEANATSSVKTYNPSQLGMDGGNGWTIGTDILQYSITGSRSAGNLGFTTQLFWEYYEYTQDKTLLEKVIFPVLVSAARYIVKTVELDENGNYLVSYCDSPEQHVNGVWYHTKGTTYAQSFAYQNNYNALLAAKELGIDLTNSAVLKNEDLCVFKRVMEQLDKYDPINVGLSGQIKEFREEEYYGDLVDEPQHRHISQLVGLYPGNIINSNTPAWLDAAKVTLTERGDNATGWGVAHRLNLWARTKDGDRTYTVLNNLLSKNTATNLWDLHPPFQIDGNFGGTAGISEMLLQSHEGYIAPLAAIPSDWESGSYTGMVARGNFEVGAAWTNGYADVINVKSLSGGKASVYYEGVTSSNVVKASDGKAVSYTVSDTNLISFDTEIGETYIITNLQKPVKLEKPASASVERPGMSKMDISWDAVSGAAYYNVYVAIDNAADYTLLGTTESNSFEYIPNFAQSNSRYTFKITSANADGVESDGAICYSNPIDVNAELIDYEANLFENGELQVTVNASENTMLYKFWRKAQGDSEYSLVKESAYPFMVYEDYSQQDKYAVSIVSKYMRTETELYELTNIKSASEVSSNDYVYSENLLSSKSFIADASATSLLYTSAYGYDKLTDGIYNKDATGSTNVHAGRFATKDVASAYLDGTATFDSTSMLSEMRIYDFSGSTTSARVGESITVYTLLNDEWHTAAQLSDSASVLAARQYDSELGLYYVTIDLADIKADAVRVRAENTSSTTQGITVYEITLSGYYQASSTAENNNILIGKQFTGDAKTLVTNYTYGYDKLTDGDFGIHSGRFTLVDQAYSKVTMECDLEDVYKLYDLRIYAHDDNGVTRSKETTVEVYYCGEWIKLVDAQPLASGSDRLGGDHKYTLFSLDGVKGERLRLTFYNSSGEAKGISLYELECSGTEIYEVAGTNVLSECVSVTQSGADGVSEAHPLSNAFDGDIDTYYELTGDSSSYVLTMDLGQKYALYHLNVRDHREATDTVDGAAATRSDDTYVELYVNDEWVRIFDGVALSTSEEYTSFNIDGLIASKIRIGFNNTQTFDNGTSPAAAISEIVCSVSSGLADKKELVNAYTSLPILSDGSAEYKEQMQKFYGYIKEFGIMEKDAQLYTEEINAFAATLLDGTHTAHTIEKYDAKENSCTEGGWYAYEKCTSCDYTTYEGIAPLGHDVDSTWVYNMESHWKECANQCGIDVDFAPHSYDNADDMTCDCGYERYLTHKHTVNITVGETEKTIAVAIDYTKLHNFTELTVKATQSGVTTNITEYTTVGNNYIFSYSTASDDVVTFVLSGAGVEADTTIVCNPARFVGAGTKYVQYATLTLGDANLDGITDIKDIVRSKKMVAELITAADNADINGDGNVVATDLVLLAKYIITAKTGMTAHAVTFKDADGTVLDVVFVPDGFKAIPTVMPKENGFKEWDKPLSNITSDTEITAIYYEALPDDSLSGKVPGDWEYGD